ncbi:poly-gamma-glutamate hydrolase family protein [Staphylococcus chromogenes]|uniref:poly-gamma-glutamate hydrolase family protein n=1 Tax=Staphylococcus chromogenes TaxID=46126 RepID=UPI0028FFD837|nr:poly-gamma-glutamate hydrolase family protein [Staphylococcus chromogenes]MDU0451269.1 poly-gamma-glutamate hydrolase family protein [Staphylococcus chromogenes]
MKKMIISALLIFGVIGANMAYLTYFSTPSRADDHYESMKALMKATKEGEDWKIRTKDETNATVIVAPHGGGIEPGTTEIAEDIADKSQSGFYTFEGLRRANNSELHVTSVNYDEPKAQKMVGQSQRTVTVHRTSRDEADVYIGGRDTKLKQIITEKLLDNGFKVKQGTGSIAGEGVNNITNMNQRQAGVQLEISSKTIQRFFKNGDSSRMARVQTTNWSQTMQDFTSGVADALNA